MFTLIRFIAVLALSAAAVGVGSVAWPRFTDKPRPELLEKAYTITKNTPLGEKTAQVLGVTDSIQPIDPAKFANTLVSSASSVVEKKVETIIATQAVLQLMRQINKLDPSQQEEIRSLICSTQSASGR